MAKKTSYSLYLYLKKIIVAHKQFVLYTVIGLSGVLIDYLAYVIGVSVLGLGIILANFLSISLGIINNFILNTRYNFRVKDRLLLRFGLFYSVGFIGLILSEILLLIFHYGLEIGPLTAKLLTLPFVLITQYMFNKYVSFGSLSRSTRFVRQIIFHWPGYILLMLFTFCSLMFVKNIPASFATISDPRLLPSYAPDEAAHYGFNVGFILREKKLPVSGKDDIPAYENCRDNPSGKVPCLYSYTFYPGASYLVNAVSASVVPKIINMSPEVASRLPSTFYGMIFTLCVYFSTFLISRRRLIATLISIGIVLIPQYIFLSSYTNLDAHSVAISGVVGLTLTLFMLNPKRLLNGVLLAISTFGFLPLAKYNYFILSLPVIVVILWYYSKKIIDRRRVLLIAAWGVGSFFVLSAFWYIRNYILYNDLLGQNFAVQEMSKYHALGSSLPFDFSSIVKLTDINFFNILYHSFYLSYGGMFYFLDYYKYTIPAALSVISAVYLFTHLANNKNLKPLAVASGAYLILFFATLGQVLYNSLVYDFQPQGRYMFPILMPLALLYAYCYKTDHRLSILSVLLASGTLYIFLYGTELFMKVYIHV